MRAMLRGTIVIAAVLSFRVGMALADFTDSDFTGDMFDVPWARGPEDG